MSLIRHVAIACLCLASCAPAHYIHRYGPEQVDVQVDVYGYAGEHVWCSASVIGIRRPDPAQGRGAEVEMALRLENRSRQAVALEPRTIWLVSADLRAIGRAEVTPEPSVLAAGELAEYRILFPFGWDESPLEYDLSQLDLSWAVDFGVEIVRSRAEFILVDPYWP